ncbi:MAG TPA: CBS domain-containing protein, partial [bacterium]|nr:CBS domain-containing protein [bacterium]
RIHGAPVVDHSGGLVGMLSLVDLAGRLGTRVLHVMRTDLVTASEDADVGHLASLMLAQRVRRIPIMRGSRLVGIVSASDLIQGLLELHEAAGVREEEKV